MSNGRSSSRNTI